MSRQFRALVGVSRVKKVEKHWSIQTNLVALRRTDARRCVEGRKVEKHWSIQTNLVALRRTDARRCVEGKKG